MAPRPFWKGYLKLSLVTCPVAMMPATSEGEKLRFRTLNRKTGNRVVSQYVDAETEDVVEDDDQVKGYEREEGSYVLLEDEEIEAVALESTHTIDIEVFVPSDSVSWIWYDQPHYLLPDDKVGEEAFAVIREAMKSTRTHGISRVVLYRRERAVMLEPRDKGIVLWTLRYGDEVRQPDPYFEDAGKAAGDPKLTALMKKLIEERTQPWTEDMVSDPVQDRLLDIIAAKQKGQKRKPRPKAESDEPPSNVINIMDALKKSIESEKKGKGKS
jgi:DNA end-binding protein Ku